MAFPIRIVVAFATVTVIATAAQGQTTWFVDDANCPGPGSGTQADPFCMIQDGIDATLNGGTGAPAWLPCDDGYFQRSHAH